MDDLVLDGKVRYIACSNHATWQFAKTIDIAKPAGLNSPIDPQIQHSLLWLAQAWIIVPATLK